MGGKESLIEYWNQLSDENWRFLYGKTMNYPYDMYQLYFYSSIHGHIQINLSFRKEEKMLSLQLQFPENTHISLEKLIEGSLLTEKAGKHFAEIPKFRLLFVCGEIKSSSGTMMFGKTNHYIPPNKLHRLTCFNKEKETSLFNSFQNRIQNDFSNRNPSSSLLYGMRVSDRHIQKFKFLHKDPTPIISFLQQFGVFLVTKDEQNSNQFYVEKQDGPFELSISEPTFWDLMNDLSSQVYFVGKEEQRVY